MAQIEKGQYERISNSIEVLKTVCELFDRIPAHERRADLNFLLDKYERNPSAKQLKQDAKWKWRSRKGAGKAGAKRIDALSRLTKPWRTPSE